MEIIITAAAITLLMIGFAGILRTHSPENDPDSSEGKAVSHSEKCGYKTGADWNKASNPD